MATGNWSQEDVNRINAERAARRMPLERPETALGTTNADKSTPYTPKPPKGHKYRAEPCIVTADLTLFSKEDIRKAICAKYYDRPLSESLEKPFTTIAKSGSLKDQAAHAGIVGEHFQSLKEGRRWVELSQFQKVGAIRGLERQPNFDLFVTSPNGQSVKIGFFHADFRYVTEDGQTIIEDTKSTATATEAYRLRKRMVEAQYGISITET